MVGVTYLEGLASFPDSGETDCLLVDRPDQIVAEEEKEVPYLYSLIRMSTFTIRMMN